MKQNKTRIYSLIISSSLGLVLVDSVYGMGLRSFVALPVEKEGGVLRLGFEHAEAVKTDTLTTSAAYGLSAKQTLLLSFPYRLSSGRDNRLRDLSILYRHIVWQADRLSGTSRVGLLGGSIIPTGNEQDSAIQTGFVLTHFNNRYEIDIDAMYQTGMGKRHDSGRYDLSWQYRLIPKERPDWGIGHELFGVLELNGRWTGERGVTHQFTVGLQWVNQEWVIDGGIAKDINNGNEHHYILSTRYHF